LYFHRKYKFKKKKQNYNKSTTNNQSLNPLIHVCNQQTNYLATLTQNKTAVKCHKHQLTGQGSISKKKKTFDKKKHKKSQNQKKLKHKPKQKHQLTNQAILIHPYKKNNKYHKNKIPNKKKTTT
jgi:hypothetical protein